MEEILDNKWIVFGAVDNAVVRYLSDKYDNIAFFIDNDKNKVGKELYGKVIKDPCSTDYDRFSKYCVIISSMTEMYWDEMVQQLIEKGWPRKQIYIALKNLPCIESFEFYAYCHDIALNHPIPTVLNLELSGYCNCSCIYCPFHGELNLKDGHKGFISWNTLKQVVSQMQSIPSLKVLDVTGAGELFLHKDWLEMMQFVLDNTTMEDVCLYTNGMLFNRENIEKIGRLHAAHIRVEISIDGKTAEENDLYRIGSKYNAIKEHIYYAQNAWKDDNRISLVITNCYPADEKELQEKRAVNVPQFLIKDFPNIQLISRYTYYYGDRNKNLNIFDKIQAAWPDGYQRCLNLFNRLAVNWEGRLQKCSCGTVGIEGIADVKNSDLLEVWLTDKEINRVRENFIKGHIEHDFCSGCPSKGMGTYYVLVKKREG